ncbi:MAG: cation:H+ antiporter [Arenicella sp.]|jgi:cation:H+ antiporter
MQIEIAVALVLVGFLLLIWSADVLVDNASALAGHMGISTFMVGIVIVGFGTSAPELFVSAVASLEGRGNLALGNALGSNITNIGMVLGGAALVRTLPVSRSTAVIDLPIVLFVGVLAIVLVMDGWLSFLDGIILLSVLAAYLIWSAKSEKILEVESSSSDLDDDEPSNSTTVYATWTVFSIVLLMVASQMLVSGAVTIAEYFGVGELIIGLTIVAIGTSLPELAAAIAAARKGVHDMIIGNIIGSNIFNTLGVLGLTGLLRSTEIDTSALWRDFPVMFAFTALMLIFALTKGRFGRREGAIFLLGYLAYLGYLIFTSV